MTATAHAETTSLYETYAAMQVADRSMFRNLAIRHGLHENALRALVVTTESEHSLTPSMLASRLRLTTGTVTALLDVLSRRDLLHRVPNPADRRGSLLKATDSGGQLGDAVSAAYQSALEHAVPAAEVTTLEKHLRSIAVALNDAGRSVT